MTAVEERPDYVRCVRQPYEDDRKYSTWCNRPVVGFVFVSIDHAATNAANEGRLLVCPQCADTINRTLQGGTWRPDPVASPPSQLTAAQKKDAQQIVAVAKLGVERVGFVDGHHLLTAYQEMYALVAVRALMELYKALEK